MIPIERVVIDGRLGDSGDLAVTVAARYGHFTAMQVRDQRVRGFDVHLARLQNATRELFGAELDTGLVVDSITTALGDDLMDASVRVYVTQADPLTVIVTTRGPSEAPSTPQRLKSVVYQRFLPHIKHTGGFPQAFFGGRVAAEGFDEALFTLADGTICEGSITNLGCFDGTRLIWPDGPQLRGSTMQIMQRAGAFDHVTRPVTVAELPGFAAVFTANSWGVAPVGAVDDRELTYDKAVMASLIDLYVNTPWDPICAPG